MSADMQYHEAKFLISGVQPSQWPDSTLPEIIFAGRSNAGKSSLINTLVNRKNLAFSGKTPGKTRLLNFFEIDGKVIFTDAPGYGYAKNNQGSAREFSRIIDPYFRLRKQLKAMVLVADGRRVPNDDDIAMVEYAKANHLAIIVAMTKTDKLTRSEQVLNRRKIASVLEISENVIVPCSSLKKTGIEEIWAKIDEQIARNA